jgi:hypothetical protein
MLPKRTDVKQSSAAELGTASSVAEELCVETRRGKRVPKTPVRPDGRTRVAQTGGFRVTFKAKIVAKSGVVAPERNALFLNY